MNEADFKILMETSWRRPLSEQERGQLEAWLAAHPEARAEWESEQALNRGLRALPDAPVASNFTALVLQAAEREGRVAVREPWGRRLQHWLARPLIRLSLAVLVLLGLCAVYYQHLSTTQQNVSKGLAVVANVTSLTDEALLSDFDAIHRLGESSRSQDDELYAALSE
jgi:ferric-dicitrate binding protein FerR (iron transport regulator)